MYVPGHKKKNPYQDSLYVWLILTTITYQKKFVVNKIDGFEGYVEVYIYDEENKYKHFKWILYVFIIYLYINCHQIFIYLLLQHQFDVFEYEYVCNVI